MENRKVLPLSFIRHSKSHVLLGGCGGRFSQFLATGNSQEGGGFQLVPSPPAAGSKTILDLFRSFVAADMDEH